MTELRCIWSRREQCYIGYARHEDGWLRCVSADTETACMANLRRYLGIR